MNPRCAITLTGVSLTLSAAGLVYRPNELLLVGLSAATGSSVVGRWIASRHEAALSEYSGVGVRILRFSDLLAHGSIPVLLLLLAHRQGRLPVRVQSLRAPARGLVALAGCYALLSRAGLACSYGLDRTTFLGLGGWWLAVSLCALRAYARTGTRQR